MFLEPYVGSNTRGADGGKWQFGMVCWVLETHQTGKASHRYKVTLGGEGPVNRQEPNLLPWGCVGRIVFHLCVVTDPCFLTLH